jgi:hypothetical protein
VQVLASFPHATGCIFFIIPLAYVLLNIPMDLETQDMIQVAVNTILTDRSTQDSVTKVPTVLQIHLLCQFHKFRHSNRCYNSSSSCLCLRIAIYRYHAVNPLTISTNQPSHRVSFPTHKYRGKITARIWWGN